MTSHCDGRCPARCFCTCQLQSPVHARQGQHRRGRWTWKMKNTEFLDWIFSYNFSSAGFRQSVFNSSYCRKEYRRLQLAGWVKVCWEKQALKGETETFECGGNPLSVVGIQFNGDHHKLSQPHCAKKIIRCHSAMHANGVNRYEKEAQLDKLWSGHEYKTMIAARNTPKKPPEYVIRRVNPSEIDDEEKKWLFN